MESIKPKLSLLFVLKLTLWALLLNISYAEILPWDLTTEFLQHPYLHSSAAPRILAPFTAQDLFNVIKSAPTSAVEYSPPTQPVISNGAPSVELPTITTSFVNSAYRFQDVNDINILKTGYIDISGQYHPPSQANLRSAPAKPAQSEHVSSPGIYENMNVLELLVNQESLQDSTHGCQALRAYYADYADVCCTKRSGDWSNPLTWSCGRPPKEYEVVGVFHKVAIYGSQVARLNLLALWIMSTRDETAVLSSGRFFHESICSRVASKMAAWKYLQTELKAFFDPIFDGVSFDQMCKKMTSDRLPFNMWYLNLGESSKVDLAEIMSFHKNVGIFVGQRAGLLLHQAVSLRLQPGAIIENNGVFFIGDPCVPTMQSCADSSLILDDASSNTLLAHNTLLVYKVVLSQPESVFKNMELRKNPIAMWLGHVGYNAKLPDAAQSSLTIQDGLYTVYHGMPRITFSYKTIILPVTPTSGGVILFDLRNHTGEMPNTITLLTDRIFLTSASNIKLQQNLILAFPFGNLLFRQYSNPTLDYRVSDKVSFNSTEIVMTAETISMDYAKHQGPLSVTRPSSRLSLRLNCQRACYVLNQLFLPDTPEALSKNVWV